MTDLKDKAIDIKGKKYVLVSDRVIFFNETYPDGSITTELVSDWNSELIVIKATASPDGKRLFTGYSQATVGDGYINKTSALENAETSAVGRCLGMMGIGVIESIASADELKKASFNKPYPKTFNKPDYAKGTDDVSKLVVAKSDLIKAFYAKGFTNKDEMATMIYEAIGKNTVDTIDEASQVMETI